MAPTQHPSGSSGTDRPSGWKALTALGIVYGDLGTSPLYTLQTVVQAAGGHFTSASALGILSLIVWTLIITISIKYCLFVMRADNHGEGGILALMSLVGANSFKGWSRVLTVMGLLGAALLYGDGVITPAISVLSAIEGVNVVTQALKPFVMPIAVGILLVFFAVQRFGTSRIGSAFGPIMLSWFIVIALLGLAGIVRHPIVLTAVDPRHAIAFLAHGGGTGLLVLGGVFLCITGGEALYADMGHFGKGPIRLSWYTIVLPALLLSYAGQIGLLIEKGTITGNPFFQLAPTWAIYPLVVLATIATIIASQAIVTGSFSMTRQAMQLGWLPGFNIRQTSDKVYGQIYISVVNWLMMAATIGITIAFGSSDRLAGAYGTAVSTTMLMTTCLLLVAMIRVWRWPIMIAVPIAGFFLIVDAGFFSANLLKIADGGWLPLTFGAIMFLIMLTWRSGVEAVRASIARGSEGADRFIADINGERVPRVDGTAIFFTRSSQQVPQLLIDHIRHMGALHRNVIALTVQFEETPRVSEEERFGIKPIANGIWRATIRFGFIEIPDIGSALKAVQGLNSSIELDKAVYFAARDMVTPRPELSRFARWRLALFAFLYRNSVKVVDRFKLPPDNVVEIARQIQI
ncbi:KUP/HAK/KT family potassium transporter [Sphingomonas paucimobilis]|uniref:potassium transporter Kup n=1 Tax=Sphingomonas paucimobilis TaxID=13689 RepID=UPI0030F8BA31